MKYVIRQGVFETNSSSTHSMVLLIKGTKEEVAIKKKALDDMESDSFGYTYVRTISSPLMKALILYQFYFIHIGRYTMIPPNEEEERLKNIDEYELATYQEDKEKIENFKKKIFKRFTSKKDKGYIEKMDHILREEFYRYMPMCNECFLNDCLADCTCGMDYESICKSLDVDPNKEGAEDEVIEKIFDDNVYFLITEDWMGGWFDENFPNDF